VAEARGLSTSEGRPSPPIEVLFILPFALVGSSPTAGIGVVVVSLVSIVGVGSIVDIGAVLAAASGVGTMSVVGMGSSVVAASISSG
jgi:hypothetical protein